MRRQIGHSSVEVTDVPGGEATARAAQPLFGVPDRVFDLVRRIHQDLFEGLPASVRAATVRRDSALEAVQHARDSELRAARDVRDAELSRTQQARTSAQRALEHYASEQLVHVASVAANASKSLDTIKRLRRQADEFLRARELEPLPPKPCQALPTATVDSLRRRVNLLIARSYPGFWPTSDGDR